MKPAHHEDEHDHVFEDAKEHGWHSRGHSRIPSNWDVVSVRFFWDFSMHHNPIIRYKQFVMS